jgi:hypothetical protein
LLLAYAPILQHCRDLPQPLSAAFDWYAGASGQLNVPYVVPGWLPIIAARPMLTAMPPGCLMLAVGSAACYVLGIRFLKGNKRYRYFHAVWHARAAAAVRQQSGTSSPFTPPPPRR